MGEGQLSPNTKEILMQYLKRKDGTVFGKLDDAPKATINQYLKDGCIKCDENGKELKVTKTKKKK